MSAGHEHADWQSADTVKLERVMRNPAIEQWLWRFRQINREHDLPYLAGYSQDGNTIYFDRHLPDEIEIAVDGTKWVINPIDIIREHEEIEKALIDVLGWQYGPSHGVANARERRCVLMKGIPWIPYNQALAPYVKTDEQERLKTVPPDLDMTPYLFPPVNRTLIKAMRAAMGPQKLEKTDRRVNYSDDRGRPSRHCGPDRDWPKGYCRFFDGNNSCSRVEGRIAEHGGCDLYVRAQQ